MREPMGISIVVIGLGQMGSAIAKRLLASGFDVRGYDMSDTVRERLTVEGLTVSTTLEEAIENRNVIITSLPDSAAVSSTFLSDNGILAKATPGASIIEMSTIDPETMRSIGGACGRSGHNIVDCPVSGRPGDAAEGKLVLLVGGIEKNIETIREILVALGGSKWHFTGDVGTAKVVKIVNNLMALGNVMVAAEAFALGTAAGVDERRLYDILSVSGGRSHHFVARFPAALERNWEPGFKMELAEKDMVLGLDLARSMHLPTPAAALGQNLYSLALAQGFGGKDIVSVLAMYRSWFGLEDPH